MKYWKSFLTKWKLTRYQNFFNIYIIYISSMLRIMKCTFYNLNIVFKIHLFYRTIHKNNFLRHVTFLLVPYHLYTGNGFLLVPVTFLYVFGNKHCYYSCFICWFKLILLYFYIHPLFSHKLDFFIIFMVLLLLMY